MKRTIQTIIILLILGTGTTHVFAATLSFGSQCVSIPVGESCNVDIVLETAESLNTVEIEVATGEMFRAVALNEANSIVSYWIERPSIGANRQSVSLAGIMPGGFTGKGKVLSFTLEATRAGESTTEFRNAIAYLNDGSGSKIDLKTQQVLLKSTEATDGFIPQAEEPDLDPPLIFYPEVARDANIFSRKWFIVFQTQDKGSGIDHYEVAETKTDYVSDSDWKVAESPYRFKDQRLTSYIHIKAVDRAGNERVVIIPPREATSPQYGKISTLAVILAIATVVAAVLLRRKRNIK